MKEENRTIENYRQYFTKEYMMGPNSLRLLAELLDRNPEAVNGGRVMDLGCGEALTSVFLANETNAETVYAVDLWISATDNWKRICENRLEEKMIPIHADALELPFAQEYFDTIVSVDSYHYFGCGDGIFAEKILPFVKKDGYVLICIPGIKREPEGEEIGLMQKWAEEDTAMFHTVEWWKKHLEKGCEDQISVEAYEADCFEKAWQEWIESGNEYGVRDAEFLNRGLRDLLNFVMLVVKRR